MKSQAKQNMRLMLVLLGVVALNMSWLQGPTDRGETSELASVGGCDIENGLKGRDSIQCQLVAPEKVIGGEKTSIDGKLQVKRSREKIVTGGGSDDPSGKTPKTAGKTEEVDVYYVSIETNATSCPSCTYKIRQDKLIGSNFTSFRDLQAAIVQYAQKAHADNIKDISDEAKKAKDDELKAQREEKLRASREKRAELCLIERGTPLDQKEVPLKGQAKLECNMDRMAEAKTKDAEDIYHNQVKSEIAKMLASGDPEQVANAREMMRALNSSEYNKIGKKSFSVASSLYIMDRASLAHEQLAALQGRLAEAGSQGEQIMINQQIIGLKSQIDQEFFTYPRLLAQDGQLDPRTHDDYQLWQSLLKDKGAIGTRYDQSTIANRRFSGGLPDIQLDMHYRQARALQGDTLFNSQQQFSAIRVPSPTAGYVNGLNQNIMNNGRIVNQPMINNQIQNRTTTQRRGIPANVGQVPMAGQIPSSGSMVQW